MAAPPTLGEFEHIVLLAILRLGENAYGVTLRQEIQERTDRHPSPGALYITVDRLENKGFVSSRFGDPTPQRGGRAKRFYRVRPAGSKAVERAEAAFVALGRMLGRDPGRS